MLYHNLIAFLRARLDEDADLALWIVNNHSWFGIHVDAPTEVAAHIERHYPHRVLAEVNAKREIVDELTHKATRDDGDSASPEEWQATDKARWLLHCMAAIYNDHPEYPTLKGTDQ